MSSRSLARTLAPLFLCMACACSICGLQAIRPEEATEDAFQALVVADNWRDRNAARDRLVALDQEAYEAVLSGTRHEDEDVRASCYEILREHHAEDALAIEAFLNGLDDSNQTFVAYPSAFHLGEHKIEASQDALRACLEDSEVGSRTYYAAAKSLGELGEAEVMVTLWSGLGSDDAYTRYLCNLGVKGLTGKDLTDFEYEGAWEGAFVSGPAVMTVQGQPIAKAQKRVARWEAIVRFTTWLQAERPGLIAELDEGLW